MEDQEPLESDAGDEEPEQPPAAQMLRRGSQSSIDLAKEAQANQPKRKQGSRMFMQTGSTATRQQMIEYLSLLRWSQATWVSAPYAILLWASVVTIINYRASSIASHEVRRGVIDNLKLIEALPTRGMAPAEVRVGQKLGEQQGGSTCSCTCAVFRSELCEAERPERRYNFQGTMSLGHVAELRAQSAYFEEGVANVSWQGLRWKDIRNRQDVLVWLQHGLLPVLWNEVGRDTAVDVTRMFDPAAASILATQATPGIFMNWMQIVGGVRLRQRRLQQGACEIDSRLQERYQPECYTEFFQVSPFGPGIGSDAAGFVPEDALGAFDVRYSLGTPFREILENFEYMLKEHHWLGEASESLRVQAAMVHGEATPPFFVMFEVRFDFKRSGYVAKDLNIFLTATDMFPTTFEVVLHILWAIILFSLLFTQSFKTMSTYLSTRKKKLFAVDVRFVSDWIVIVFSIFITGFFILIQQSIWDLAALVQEMPPYDPTALAAEMENHEKSWTLILDRVDEAAFFFDYFRVALFWYTLVIATQFSKIFAGQPKLAQLMSAFTHASEDLLHFCLLFVVLFISFAIGGFMIWGMIMEEWSTPAKAVNSTLRTLMGQVSLEEMFGYAPIGAMVWYGAFFISIVVITLNLLVAMVYDHYTIIKSRAGSVAGVLEQLHWVSQDMAARVKGKSLWVKLTCCLRRHEGIPQHRDLLEHFMEQAQLPTYERKAINSTVLGAKWTKKERERAMFSGQEIAETMENEPILKDFEQFEINPDYKDSLQAHSKEYADAGYDPEDARVSQLRQLVSAAEDEIVDMRLRLQSCAEYTRQSMHGLTKRVDSLETLVHQTLAELVTIANEAGVPTGGKARKSQAPTSPVAANPGSPSAQTGVTGAQGSRQEAKSQIDMVKKWHKASRAVNLRAARAAPPPNAKFFGPR